MILCMQIKEEEEEEEEEEEQEEQEEQGEREIFYYALLWCFSVFAGTLDVAGILLHHWAPE